MMVFRRTAVIAQCEKANRTNGTFGFSNTQANAQKTKRAIFFQRSTKNC